MIPLVPLWDLKTPLLHVYTAGQNISEASVVNWANNYYFKKSLSKSYLSFWGN